MTASDREIVSTRVLPWPRERVLFQVTTTFAEEAGKTRLTFRMLFGTAAECDKVKRLAVGANEENFDRLEAELASMA
jgi:hypothetical protein